uniref:Uncharacterized protein n=1 Tax=Erythroglossum lusitanicum TaxID=2575615 RepID=A0A4D6WUZ0_9FLOR|nr:hypothetical protein [Erythroglossum lusitanicum]
MNLKIYSFNKFHPIIILSKKTIKENSLDLRITKYIPIKWQIILINEGSFTKTLNALTGQKIKMKMYQKYNYRAKNIKRNIRCVWLETYIYTKLTFARSIWIFVDQNIINMKFIKNKPIGKALIDNQIDIYKNIHEIYYGYCKYLEKQFIVNQLIWARKYTLYYNYTSYLTVQEFFSPYIKNLFN